MSSIKYLIRQYGALQVFRKAIQRVFRPIYCRNSFHIFVCMSGKRPTLSDGVLVVKKRVELERVLKDARVSENTRIILERNTNLNQDVLLLYIREAKLMAYAHIQTSGVYYYGRRSSLIIPKGIHIMKNLYVIPEFRGRGIGSVLNSSRLSAVPKDVIPYGFIIAGNKIAVRNWERFGFVCVGTVQETVVITKRKKTKVIIGKPSYALNSMVKALNGGEE